MMQSTNKLSKNSEMQIKWIWDNVCQSEVLRTWSFNSLWPSGTIRWHGSLSTLVQVMASYLTAQSHYLNQCWLIIKMYKCQSLQKPVLHRDFPILDHFSPDTFDLLNDLCYTCMKEASHSEEAEILQSVYTRDAPTPGYKQWSCIISVKTNWFHIKTWSLPLQHQKTLILLESLLQT